jgi:predicted metal-dependent peptidase
MTPVTKDHHHALSKAKIQLMARPDSAFFMTVCFSMKHVWDETIPTACTNGREIRFNPAFFMSLSLALQVSLLVHESMHVAYLHMERVQARDPRKWNVAGDYVINQQLHERGFEIGKTWLLDAKYAGMSTEEVYKLLPEDPPSPSMDDLVYGETPEISDSIRREVEDILVRASVQSKMSGDKPGTIPGDIQVYLDGLLNPVLPWNRILQKYMRSFDKSDYSFRKPNRRFFPEHHMPTLWGESLMDLCIAVDISGSVSDHDFKVFVSEVAGIFKMMKPSRITLIQFDTEIKSTDTVKSVRELMGIKFTGRGGTCISPVMEWAKEHKPQLLMVFSDGEFNFYGNEFQGDTLYLIHNNTGFTPPRGKVIHYEIKQ